MTGAAWSVLTAFTPILHLLAWQQVSDVMTHATGSVLTVCTLTLVLFI